MFSHQDALNHPRKRQESPFRAPGVQLRFHSTPLYNSMYRFDDDMLVNMHAYVHPAAMSPVMHLRRLADGRLFDHYLTSLDKVWETASGPVEGVP